MCVLQGAAEYVLANCTRYMNEDGKVVELSGQMREQLQGVITAMADRGLRTLCLAFRDMPDAPAASDLEEQPAEDLTACCIVGIKVRAPPPPPPPPRAGTDTDPTCRILSNF